MGGSGALPCTESSRKPGSSPGLPIPAAPRHASATTRHHRHPRWRDQTATAASMTGRRASPAWAEKTRHRSCWYRQVAFGLPEEQALSSACRVAMARFSSASMFSS
jgi:hypothetical protein